MELECYGCQKMIPIKSRDDLPAIIDPYYCEECKDKKK